MKTDIFAYAIAASLLATTVGYAQSQEDLTNCRLGLTAQQNGKFDEAIALYETCAQKGNLTPRMLAVTYRNLGSSNLAVGNAQKAIEYSNQALAQNPQDPWSDFVNRGNAWSALGNYDKALQDYDEAQRLLPQFHQAYFNRGIVFEKLKRIDDAKAQFSLAYERGLRTPQMLERARYYNLAQGSERGVAMDAPVASERDFRSVLVSLGDRYQGRQICLGENSVSVEKVAADVKAYLETKMGVKGLPTPLQISTALFTQFPCPFSPDRPELRASTASDIQGVWIFPQTSQTLQFPPKSQAWNAYPPNAPFKCEVVAYFDSGEARNAVMRGASDCPFNRVSDTEPMRARPAVVKWSMQDKGRIVISRTDVTNHLEEWDVFTVLAPFTHRGVAFKTGDLVAYLRREKGNDFNIASSFRHLQRLPN